MTNIYTYKTNYLYKDKLITDKKIIFAEDEEQAEEELKNLYEEDVEELTYRLIEIEPLDQEELKAEERISDILAGII